MDFKDYVINEEDFDFFKSLPEDEKLLFIYDLICIDAYGIGSTESEDEIVIDITLDKAEAFKDFIEQFEIKMRSFIASTINLNVDCNLVFINNSVVINSNNKKEITDSVKDLYMEGYLLKELKMTEKMSLVFHHQKYCKMYEIIGYEESINLN
jgi:hypothetical protein